MTMRKTPFELKARQLLIDHLKEFHSYPEAIGTVILGGAARNSSSSLDRFSDLDAALFISVPAAIDYEGPVREFLDLNQQLLPNWLPPFSTYLSYPEHPSGQVEVNIHQLIIELEEKAGRIWDEQKKGAYKYSSEILSDTKNRLKKVIEQQTHWDDVKAQRMLLRILGQVAWYGIKNPPRQLVRNLPIEACDLIREAVELLIWAAYIINREYRPHKKWRFSRCFELSLLPADFKFRLGGIVKNLKPRSSSIYQQCSAVEELLIDMKTISQTVYNIPKDPYALSCSLSYEDRQLRFTGSISNVPLKW